MGTEQLTESVSQRDLPGRIDREKGVIRDVLILGRESKNGRTYSDKALGSAAKLFEGIEVNLDHPTGKDAAAPRGIAEGWGKLENVSRTGDQVRGDLHYLKSHEQTPILLERIERDFGGGLSHNSTGKTSRKGKAVLVEDVIKANSVDFVGRPATTENLFESTQDEPATEADKTPSLLEEVIETLRGEENPHLPAVEKAVELGLEITEGEGLIESAVRDSYAILLSQINDADKVGSLLGLLEGEPKAEPTETAHLAEQVAALAETVETLAKENAVTKSLTEFGLLESQVAPLRMRELRSAPDAESRKRMIAGWPKPPRRTPESLTEGSKKRDPESLGSIPLHEYRKAR